MNQFGKISAFLDQGLVVPFLHDGTLIHHQDPVAVADGAEAVGDDDAGAFELVQGVGDLLLGLVIQGAGPCIPG